GNSGGACRARSQGSGGVRQRMGEVAEQDLGAQRLAIPDEVGRNDRLVPPAREDQHASVSNLRKPAAGAKAWSRAVHLPNPWGRKPCLGQSLQGFVLGRPLLQGGQVGFGVPTEQQGPTVVLTMLVSVWKVLPHPGARRKPSFPRHP